MLKRIALVLFGLIAFSAAGAQETWESGKHYFPIEPPQGTSSGDKIEVVAFDALLMSFAEKVGASIIIRGLRAVADFEYEYQMAGMNQQLNNSIETVFLMADVALQPIASRLVKEIALYGGEIHKFAPPAVVKEVIARVEKIGKKGS
jgi:pantetheine-phosphate adenylyltransferase